MKNTSKTTEALFCEKLMSNEQIFGCFRHKQKIFLFGLHLCTHAPCGVCNGVLTIKDTNENLQSLFKKQLLKTGLFSLPNGRQSKKKEGEKTTQSFQQKNVSRTYLNKKKTG